MRHGMTIRQRMQQHGIEHPGQNGIDESVHDLLDKLDRAKPRPLASNKDNDEHHAEMMRLAEKVKEMLRQVQKHPSPEGSWQDYFEDVAVRLAEHVETLDRRLQNGGVLPTAWQNDGTMGGH